MSNRPLETHYFAIGIFIIKLDAYWPWAGPDGAKGLRLKAMTLQQKASHSRAGSLNVTYSSL